MWRVLPGKKTTGRLETYQKLGLWGGQWKTPKHKTTISYVHVMSLAG